MAKRKRAENSNNKEPQASGLPKLQGGPILACIDMGTNSFHMIICQATSERDHFEVVSKVKEAVPFFRRSLSAHYIDGVAMRSAIRILRDMLKKAESYGASTVLAVATSAVRESRNGAEALQQIKQELKLDVRMISGKEEARLIYLGVLWSMPFLKDNFGIIDIGGGSTEIIVANPFRTFFTESYKLGAARLTERFFRPNGFTKNTIQELHNEVKGVLRPTSSHIEAPGFKILIGTSGTIQTLAKMDRERMKQPYAELHGYKLPLSRLEKLVQHIEEVSLTGDRVHGISADRSQTILAGAIVLLETMRALRADEVMVCMAALREGVVVDRFLQTGWLTAGLEHHRHPRSASVHDLIEKYQGKFEHAEQVARLAMEIFTQTRGILHDYPDEVGHWLWAAAMLHDVGMFIARNGHHKHSYYLIKHGGLLGHSEEEVSLIASIARYHRGSEPKDTHEAYYTISSPLRRLVSDLAAILRVAEALDRSHRQVIRTIAVNINSRSQDTAKQKITLSVKLKSGENCNPETWALNEKKTFFEDQFGIKLELSAKEKESLGHSKLDKQYASAANNKS